MENIGIMCSNRSYPMELQMEDDVYLYMIWTGADDLFVKMDKSSVIRRYLSASYGVFSQFASIFTALFGKKQSELDFVVKIWAALSKKYCRSKNHEYSSAGEIKDHYIVGLTPA